MNRTKDSDLDDMLRRLNESSKAKYRIDHAHGGVRLMVERGHGVSDISYRISKRELYGQILTILNYIEYEDVHSK